MGTKHSTGAILQTNVYYDTTDDAASVSVLGLAGFKVIKILSFKECLSNGAHSDIPTEYIHWMVLVKALYLMVIWLHFDEQIMGHFIYTFQQVIHPSLTQCTFLFRSLISETLCNHLSSYHKNWVKKLLISFYYSAVCLFWMNDFWDDTRLFCSLHSFILL